MAETLHTIRTRRSTKRFKPDPVPAELIKQIAEAGTYAASGLGKQSSIILAVTDKEKRDQLSRMNAAVKNLTDDLFYGAPAVLVVLADKTVPTYVYDGSLVMGNMMLAAEALGLGHCWIHRAKEEFETEGGKAFLEALGITGDYEGIGHLVLGYPDGEKRPEQPRKENYIYYVD